MVTSVTTLGKTGLSDWLIQRVSAVIIAAYTFWLLAMIFSHPGIRFEEWLGLFASGWVKIFTLATIVAICAHAWIGLWIIATDYIKISGVRLIFQLICNFLLLFYVLWTIQILWDL